MTGPLRSRMKKDVLVCKPRAPIPSPKVVLRAKSEDPVIVQFVAKCGHVVTFDDQKKDEHRKRRLAAALRKKCIECRRADQLAEDKNRRDRIARKEKIKGHPSTFLLTGAKYIVVLADDGEWHCEVDCLGVSATARNASFVGVTAAAAIKWRDRYRRENPETDSKTESITTK